MLGELLFVLGDLRSKGHLSEAAFDLGHISLVDAILSGDESSEEEEGEDPEGNVQDSVHVIAFIVKNNYKD
jgi:hypothetical protein